MELKQHLSSMESLLGINAPWVVLRASRRARVEPCASMCLCRVDVQLVYVHMWITYTSELLYVCVTYIGLGRLSQEHVCVYVREFVRIESRL